MTNYLVISDIYYGTALKNISDLLGVSANVVSVRIHRALNTLRIKFAKK
mgnify:CR=1 FL=1